MGTSKEKTVHTVECPSCHKAYKVPQRRLGTRAQCKQCGQTFTLTGAADETHSNHPHRPHRASGNSADGSTELLPGKHLGTYELKERIGAGGMGEVWLAHDPHLERDVAIKILPAAIAHNAERRERFAREAKLAARLNHPNAVIVYQFVIEEQHAFTVMEFVDGPSLDKVVNVDGPLDWREATRLICDAARGLDAAHQIGLVHRDVKPSNLITTSKGVTKVVDFGLAREQLADTQLTQEGALLGTPAYMAPEQWAGGDVDARTDLYSLICTYYYLLTGRMPYEAPSLPALGYLHRHEPFPDPRLVVPDLPDEVCSIVARGAQKDPADRFQCAADLIDKLQALCESAPTFATYETVEASLIHEAQLVDHPPSTVFDPLAPQATIEAQIALPTSPAVAGTTSNTFVDALRRTRDKLFANLTWLYILLGAGGVGLFVCCGGCMFFGAFGPGDGSGEVKAAFRDHPCIVEHIGDVRSVEFNLLDSMEQDGTTTYVYDVKGDKSDGKIITEESSNMWKVEILTADLELPDGQRFRLR